MKFLAIIQARCGSSRLPAKVLKDLCGKTALERVIDRVKKSKYMDEVIVATTINKEDILVWGMQESVEKREELRKTIFKVQTMRDMLSWDGIIECLICVLLLHLDK